MIDERGRLLEEGNGLAGTSVSKQETRGFVVDFPGVRVELQGLADELSRFFLAAFAFEEIRLYAVTDRKIRVDLKDLLCGRKRIDVLRVPESEAKLGKRQQGPG